MDYEILLSLIPNDCDRSHTQCIAFNELIQFFHQNGGMVDNLCVAKLTQFMKRRGGCTDNIREFLKIFNYLTPTETNVTSIYSVCSVEQCFDIISRILKHNPTGITFDMLELLHHMKKVRFTYNYILKKCFTFINPTKESIQMFTKYYNWEMVEFIYNQKKTLFDTTILGSMLINNLDIAKQWIEKTGISPDSDCLQKACNAGTIELIEYIISFRVHPTKECIKAVILHGPNISYCKGKKRYTNNYYNITFTEEQVNNIIDRMVEEGYKVSIEDVELALKKGIKIDRLDQYGIPMDEKLLGICYKHNIFPYDINVAPDINCVREICSKGNNISEIKKALKGNNIKPDYECLKKASKVGRNSAVVSYLMDEHGIEPDIECVQECLTVIPYSETARILLEKLEDVFVQKNTKIMEQEDTIKQLTNTDIHFVPTQQSDDNDDILSSIPENHMDGSEESSYEELVSDDHSDSESDSEELVNKSATSENENENNIVSEIVTFNIEKISSRQVKKEVVLFKDVAKLFKIKKASFIELRNALLEMIMKEKMVDVNDKNIINISDKLCNLLIIPRKSKINIDQIDNMVTQMITGKSGNDSKLITPFLI